MDEIQEEFEKNVYNVIDMQKAIQVGIKSADLLPTEKVCPECEGKYRKVRDRTEGETGILYGTKIVEYCPYCIKGILQIYYTPAQYEKITDKNFPDEGMVYVLYEHPTYWTYCNYKFAKKIKTPSNYILIIQTAQPAPDADYRPEE